MARKIYLDCAATTPVDPAVRRAMEPYIDDAFGNPSSLHSFGQEAIAAVDRSREAIAREIGAQFREIIFTGSATEANNLAIRGVAKRCMNYDNPRIIISAIEHESIQETALDVARNGVEVVAVPVHRNGAVDVKKLAQALNERTALVSVMYANNEAGTVQPISEIAGIIREFRQRGGGAVRCGTRTVAHMSSGTHHYASLPLFHTDAVQAFQFLDCDVKKLGVDMLTLSAHKIYGPKGIGALYVRQAANLRSKLKPRGGSRQGASTMSRAAIPMSPVTTGGGQEFGLRSGTENVPAIVGFAEAARIAARTREKESTRIAKLREMLWRGIKEACPKAEVNGIAISNFQFPISKLTLPNIFNVYFPGYLAEGLLVKLDRAGVAASAGPACSSRSAEPSRVIRALGYSAKRARGSLRFSMGRFTTDEEIGEAVKIIRKTLSHKK